MAGKVGLWVKGTRAPFSTASIIPVAVGTALAFRDGSFNLWYFLLALAGILAIHAGTNLANDYFDHVSTNDEINLWVTPFSGGSRMIQEGLLTPGQVFRATFISFALASVIMVVLVYLRGWHILWLGLAGILLGYFYTATPAKLGYRGVGEAVTGILLGPLAVMGAYYVQTLTFSWTSFWVSLPVGLLVAGILYINQFPDYDADKAVGKNHLVVLLGRKEASRFYISLLVSVYLVVVVGVALKPSMWPVLAVLLTAPIAMGGARVALAHYDSPREIIPAQAATIQLHMAVGVILTLAIIVARFV